MSELKSCPFCGGEARILLNAKRKIYGKDEYMTGVVACCNVCEARMFYGSEKLAIEAWNRRAGNGISKDTIYRQDAIDAVIHRDSNCGIDSAEVLKLLPSAQPEIIRCKDCNHRNRYRFPPQYEERDYCEEHEKVVRGDCYCAWAERGQDE